MSSDKYIQWWAPVIRIRTFLLPQKVFSCPFVLVPSSPPVISVTQCHVPESHPRLTPSHCHAGSAGWSSLATRPLPQFWVFGGFCSFFPWAQHAFLWGKPGPTVVSLRADCHQQCVRVPVTSHPRQRLLLSVFIWAVVVGVKLSHCGFQETFKKLIDLIFLEQF